MHAMQYELTLPADYDMDVIRARVARVGHLLDDWDGLGFKTYLMRERGVNGSPVNQYAPFYLWNTVEGMNTFLWGGAFQGLGNDFGRPAVRQWTGLAYEEGGAAGPPPRFAVRRRQPVPEGVELARGDGGGGGRDGAAGRGRTARCSRRPPWTRPLGDSCTSRSGRTTAPKADGELFEVLHVSAPGRDRLPRGRQW